MTRDDRRRMAFDAALALRAMQRVDDPWKRGVRG